MNPRGALGWSDILTRVQARIRRSRNRIVPGRELDQSIDIGRIMCPLRYDLYVRIEFIRLLRDEWALYTGDLSRFLERPQAKAYYIWFREVACARFRPEIYTDDELVQSAFLTRVHETASLWRSISSKGYNLSHPIRLQSSRLIRKVNGKAISSTYFAGNGCHRLSCLYLMGHDRLGPEYYEVEITPNYQPLDNTAILIKKLPLDRPGYLHFISRFYCRGRELDTVDEIRQQVASTNPSLLPELESVLAFDLASLPTS